MSPRAYTYIHDGRRDHALCRVAGEEHGRGKGAWGAGDVLHGAPFIPARIHMRVLEVDT